MDKILIEGGAKLCGEVMISGAKNASLPIMAATLLVNGKVELGNIPDISDVGTMIKLLEFHGASISQKRCLNEELSLEIDCSTVNNFTAPYDIVRKMRASIWVLAPLLARFGMAKVSFPGGCTIGVRAIDLHLDVLSMMGTDISIDNGYINATINGRLKSCSFSFSKISVGATITAILASVLADGTSIFYNCAMEPEIVDLCHCLNKMGANISGIGTRELIVIGQCSLFPIKYDIIPDRIEAGTYIVAAIMTGGELNIRNADINVLGNFISVLKKIGCDVSCSEENIITAKSHGILKPIEVSTEPYPGFVTDLQAPLMALLTVANGVSKITENIFENRLMHVPELSRMGADIAVDGFTATIRGVRELIGADVMASDLRASISLILAGLIAKGKTTVHRVYHLDRGYPNLEKKLSACGANIRRLI